MQTIEELKADLEAVGFEVELVEHVVGDGYCVKSRAFELSDDLVESIKQIHIGARKIFLHSIEEVWAVDMDKTPLDAIKNMDLSQIVGKQAGKIRYDVV